MEVLGSSAQHRDDYSTSKHLIQEFISDSKKFYNYTWVMIKIIDDLLQLLQDRMTRKGSLLEKASLLQQNHKIRTIHVSRITY